MKRKYYVYVLIAIMAAASGCREKINIKLGDTYTRIVVEGNLTSENKVQSVILTKTSSYFANEKTPAVSGALVTISSDDTLMILTENPPGSGIYCTNGNAKGKDGKTYTLKINNVKMDGEIKSFEATSYMRKTMRLDTITSERFEPTHMEMQMYRLKEGGTYFKVNGWGQEDPVPGDYYLWDYYINGKLMTDTMGKNIFTDDALVNGNYIPGLTMFAIDAKPGDTVMVATQSISKEFYVFINALIVEVRSGGGGGMFSGPPANIIGNISNGGLGFFRATDVTFMKTVLQ